MFRATAELSKKRTSSVVSFVCSKNPASPTAKIANETNILVSTACLDIENPMFSMFLGLFSLFLFVFHRSLCCCLCRWWKYESLLIFGFGLARVCVFAFCQRWNVELVRKKANSLPLSLLHTSKSEKVRGVLENDQTDI